jgi:hypothetical protein
VKGSQKTSVCDKPSLAKLQVDPRNYSDTLKWSQPDHGNIKLFLERIRMCCIRNFVILFISEADRSLDRCTMEHS